MIKFLELLKQEREKKLLSQAKIQPFCKYENLDCIEYFIGKEVSPMSVKPENKCFCHYFHSVCVTF